MSAFVPVLPYLPMAADGSEGLKYDGRDGKRHGRGPSYSGGYGGSDLAAADAYGGYGSQVLYQRLYLYMEKKLREDLGAFILNCLCSHPLHPTTSTPHKKERNYLIN